MTTDKAGASKDPKHTFYSINEAAEMVRSHRDRILAAIRTGTLRASQPGGIGGRWIIRQDWLDAWIEKGIPKTEAEIAAKADSILKRTKRATDAELTARAEEILRRTRGH